VILSGFDTVQKEEKEMIINAELIDKLSAEHNVKWSAETVENGLTAAVLDSVAFQTILVMAALTGQRFLVVVGAAFTMGLQCGREIGKMEALEAQLSGEVK
jgi:hypothetical protein